MNIKNNKPRKRSRYKQGYFPINECLKYIGKGPIIYRSSWEYKFCKYCENNPRIVNWSSEPFVIKYFSPIDEKYHKYHPDFYMKLDDGSQYVIEVKPMKDITKPGIPRKKTAKKIASYKRALITYQTNLAKFEFAKRWCVSKGMVFKIITENFFK
jgi:hypothetical protein